MPLIDDPLGMGFIDTPDLPTPGNMPEPKPGEASVSVATPGYRQVLEAELQTNNTVGSIASFEGGTLSAYSLQAYEPDFDLGEALKGTGYENNPGLFVTARNKAHVDAIVNDLWREQQNRETIANSTWGTYLPAMLTGQALDPVNWLSLGVVGALKIAGGALVKTAVRRGAVIGAGVAVDTTAQELLLHGSQQTRTVEESAINVGGSLLMGALIGTVGSKLLLRSERLALEKQLEAEMRELDAPEPPLSQRPEGMARASDVGAAATAVDDATQAPTLKGSFGVGWISSKMGPMQRTVRSAIEATRRAANELIETPYIFKENLTGQITAPRGDSLGRPGTVQARLGSVWEARVMSQIYGIRDLYLEYRGVQARDFAARAKLGLNDAIGRRGEAMSEVEFREAITDAINNGGAHEIPEVAKAAGLVRDKYLKHVEDDGRESGVVKEGEEVIPRAYNTQKIIEDQPRFREIVVEHLRVRRDQHIAELDALERQKAAQAADDVDLTADQRAQRDLARARDQAARDAEREGPIRYQGLPVTDEEIDAIVDFWKYVREQEAKPKPEGLASFVVRTGGLEDPGGEVLNIIGRHRDRPGLIRKGPENADPGMAGLGARESSGRSLDDWALRAWESGFFPQHTERPTIDEFLDALADDLGGNPRVRGDDEGFFDDLAVAREMEEELTQYGITPRQFRTEARLREFFGQKVARAAGEGEEAAGSAAGRQGEAEPAPKLSAAEERLRLRANMQDADLLDLANIIVGRLRSRVEGRTAHDAHLIRDENGFIKEDALLTREDFALPYNRVRDFVQRDIELLMRMMHRSMVPDIEIALRFGSADMADVLRAVQKEATERMNATTDAKERAKINKQAERDVRDLAIARDRLNGRYALPDDPSSIAVRAGRFARDAATVTKMGFSAFASVPETARIITARGVGAVFSDLMYPAMKQWSEFVRTSADARMITHALDHHTAARAMAIADGAEDWGNLPKVDRFSREATKTFMRFTGLPKLTDWQKTLSSVASMKSILEASEAMAGGSITTKQLTFLSRLGISKENAVKIAEQFAKHGKKEDRLWAAEIEKWDPDARAAGEAMMAGMRTEVDRLITTPGLDLPNMSRTELGKLIFQFKSFSIAAFERVLVSGLQHNDVPFWSSVVVQIMLAMAVNEARKAVFDPRSGKRQKSFEERWADPAERNQMFLDAIDRAGVLGWMTDVNATMDRAFGAGLTSTIGNNQGTRRASTAGDIIEKFAGPAIGQGADTTLFGYRLAQHLTGRRDLTEADTRRLQRITPIIGLPYIRGGLEALGAEQAINRELGVRSR